jgi:hypothetical protein
VKKDIILWLQNWYFSNCDGDWEHCYGIKISTLDNPGWYVEINLQETEFENIECSVIQIERSDNDWVHCKIKENIFIGAGGPNNLIEIITLFKEWVTLCSE